MKYVTIAAMVCLTASGCLSSSLIRSPADLLTAPIEAVKGPKKTGNVAKVLCLWEAAEGQGLDEKPTRGFAGQIMFFGFGEATPVATKGTVRIYEYVNYNSEDEDPQPVHEFVFDDGAWNAHRVEGTVGNTYNVFLPYVQKDKGHVVCALRVEFESEKGRIVSSPFTEVTLTGKSKARPTAALQRNIVSEKESGVRPASGTSRNEHMRQEVERKLESTTIRLPSKSRQ